LANDATGYCNDEAGCAGPRAGREEGDHHLANDATGYCNDEAGCAGPRAGREEGDHHLANDATGYCNDEAGCAGLSVGREEWGVGREAPGAAREDSPAHAPRRRRQAVAVVSVVLRSRQAPDRNLA
jgi:hypothetical protein